MKKFLISAAAAATLIGGSFALAAWSPMGTAGAQEGDTSTMDHAGHRGARGGQRLGVVAESLGIDAEELRAQLVDGATLAEIAGDGVDALVADLVAQATERAAAAVEAGKIDQAQADEMLAGVEAKISERINTVVTPGDHAGRRGSGGHDGAMGARGGQRLGVVAESLGIDAEELRAQLVDGATLAEIAGDGVDALVADLVAQATERAAAAVEAGKIDQAQADEMLAGVEAKITERINTVVTPGDHAGHRPKMAPGLMPKGMDAGHSGSMLSLDGSRMSVRPFGGNIQPLPVPATNA